MGADEASLLWKQHRGLRDANQDGRRAGGKQGEPEGAGCHRLMACFPLLIHVPHVVYWAYCFEGLCPPLAGDLAGSDYVRAIHAFSVSGKDA